MPPRGWCTRSPAPPANEADINQTAALLHGEEKAVFANAGYTGAAKQPELADRALSWNIAIKPKIIKALAPRLRERAAAEEKAKAQVRAWVEHPFHIIKDRFHYRKVRYRGLRKLQPVRAGQSADRQETASGLRASAVVAAAAAT